MSTGCKSAAVTYAILVYFPWSDFCSVKLEANQGYLNCTPGMRHWNMGDALDGFYTVYIYTSNSVAESQRVEVYPIGLLCPKQELL